MNRYSALSNFEINELIVMHDDSIPEFAERTSFAGHGDDAIYFIIFHSPICEGELIKRDYCHTLEDIVRLKNSGRIIIQAVGKKWCASASFLAASTTNKNMCRAVAECYLLMRDELNG